MQRIRLFKAISFSKVAYRRFVSHHFKFTCQQSEVHCKLYAAVNSRAPLWSPTLQPRWSLSFCPVSGSLQYLSGGYPWRVFRFMYTFLKSLLLEMIIIETSAVGLGPRSGDLPPARSYTLWRKDGFVVTISYYKNVPPDETVNSPENSTFWLLALFFRFGDHVCVPSGQGLGAEGTWFSLSGFYPQLEDMKIWIVPINTAV